MLGPHNDCGRWLTMGNCKWGPGIVALLLDVDNCYILLLYFDIDKHFSFEPTIAVHQNSVKTGEGTYPDV